MVFTVYGKPQGKGRPRFTRTGHAYTPDSVRSMYLAAGDAFSMDRALPAPEAPKEAVAEPEPAFCPDSAKEALDTMRKKADADKVESAKKQVAAFMKGFGIPRVGGCDG